MGNAYIATNEFTKAENVLKEVIDIDPNNIPAREELFQVYVKEGNLDAANGVLKEITSLDPQKDMGQYRTDLDLAQAINTSKISYELGIKQMNDKQYIEAIDCFQKVIKDDTERYDDAQTKTSDCKKAFVDVTLQKAKDAAANKDYKTALDLIDQVLKVDPDNQEALQLKGDYNNAALNTRSEIVQRIQNQSIYHFEMKNNQNQSYDVYIYADNIETEVASYFGGMINEGDILKKGVFKIGYIRKDSNQLNIYQQLFSGETHTFDISHSEMRFIKNHQTGQPDLLVVGSRESSQHYGINVYCINNNELILIRFEDNGKVFDYPIAQAANKGPWFKQADAESFETGFYANVGEAGFYITTCEIRSGT